jgi:small subunit ribosomal protein S17
MVKKKKIKENIRNKETEEIKESKNGKCEDRRCPFHGKLRVHGRMFKGNIKKIVGKRAIIEFERLIFSNKYERYMKKKTRLHAHIPDCIQIELGDLVQVGGCRPLSKITHFVILKKLTIKNK